MPDIKGFRELYDRVTEDLGSYVVKAAAQNKLSPDEAQWFFHLIKEFEAEFLKWGSKSQHPTVVDYLRLLDDSGKDLRLAGHVFLHISYDLPRVIADTLMTPHAAPSVAPNLQMPAEVGGPIFVRPGPRFLKVFVEHAQSGMLGRLAWIFGHVDAMRVLGFWVIALRSVAWIHAVRLAESPSNRGVLEDRMRDGLLNALNEVKKRKWVWGIADLDSQDFALAVQPPFAMQILEQTSPATVMTGTALGAAAAAGLGAYALGVYRRRRLALIEGFGALVQLHMGRALSTHEGDQGQASSRERE